jgi:hypothetical protein
MASCSPRHCRGRSASWSCTACTGRRSTRTSTTVGSIPSHSRRTSGHPASGCLRTAASSASSRGPFSRNGSSSEVSPAWPGRSGPACQSSPRPSRTFAPWQPAAASRAACPSASGSASPPLHDSAAGWRGIGRLGADHGGDRLLLVPRRPGRRAMMIGPGPWGRAGARHTRPAFGVLLRYRLGPTISGQRGAGAGQGGPLEAS